MIILTVLAIVLFGGLLFQAIKLSLKVAWGIIKVIAYALCIIAVPVLIVVVSLGGVLLLVPIILVAVACGLLGSRAE